MLTPSDTFKIQRGAAWFLPILSGISVVLMVAGARGGLGSVSHWLLPVVLITWLLAQVSIWLSLYGSRTTLVAVVVMVSCFVLPFSLAMSPMLTHPGDLSIMGASLLLHLLVLMASTAWRLWQLRSPAVNGDGVLEWFMCRIHLDTRRIERSIKASGGAGVSAAWVGALSVASYPLLKSWVGDGGLQLFAVCFSHGLAGWLYVFVLSRWWAQAWRLRTIERREGALFVSDRLAWLEAQRQQSAWGRLLRRLWPLPPGLELGEVQESPQRSAHRARGAQRDRQKKR